MYTTEIGSDLVKAKYLLEQGELVAIPTETVYGLAGNGLDSNAIAKIYAAKNRPQFNPLILHVGSIEQMEKWVAEIPDLCRLLIHHFSPGPITYLLPKSAQVPDLITAGSSRVAIRIPDHPVTLQLLNSLEFPLAAPSANPSGYVSPVSSQHVFEGLNGKIPYIIEGGSCKIGLESTIVGFQDNKVVVHRLGGISIEEIQAVCNVDVVVQLAHAQPTAPGQLKSHYATKKLLLQGDIRENISLHSGKKVGILSFNTKYHISNSLEYVLSTNGSLPEAAFELFSAMRSLDQSDVDIILAEFFPDEGLGKSINDRLARAAYPNKSGK
ncbi:MAG: threonylcarbamoyl-AMP synthase [Chitinophagaceae bacterium]|jgi:L-threonylcarbamoyladenylate synthase|nr:threonylcarbamoyl-AMP synthase [Chitinophagaceae bacterium]